MSIINSLTPAQQRAAIALAYGSTLTVAAEAAGIHRATIYNWYRTDAAFKAAVEDIARERRQRVEDDLRELDSIALDTLREVLTSPDVSAATRLRAALAVLNRRDNWKLPVMPDLAATLQAEPALAAESAFDTIRQFSTSPESECLAPPPAAERNEPSLQAEPALAAESAFDTIRHFSTSPESESLAPPPAAQRNEPNFAVEPALAAENAGTNPIRHHATLVATAGASSAPPLHRESPEMAFTKNPAIFSGPYQQVAGPADRIPWTASLQ